MVLLKPTLSAKLVKCSFVTSSQSDKLPLSSSINIGDRRITAILVAHSLASRVGLGKATGTKAGNGELGTVFVSEDSRAVGAIVGVVFAILVVGTNTKALGLVAC
jgi:hypothetical protein